MSKKTFDFFSSVGMMLLGIVLLFVGSISFDIVEAKRSNQQYVFPVFGKNKQVAQIALSNTTTLPVSKTLAPLPVGPLAYTHALTALSAIVIDDTTDTVLFNKNAEAVWPIASISKLLSALVLLDLPVRWSSTTVITAQDYDGLSNHVRVGEKYILEDLWKIALVGSSNTAVDALVRESATTTEDFVALMNNKSKELGLTSLHFEEPTGLNSRNVGSSKDVARLLQLALQKEKISTALSLGEYYAHPLGKEPRRIWNTDWLLLKWVPSDEVITQVIGKTGYILDSGYNFAVRFTDTNHHTIRVVVLGSATNQSRFTEARDLGAWIFSMYRWPDQEGYQQLIKIDS
jgi:D-alanyl-D-alanine endopeptidase (penicillin-binding protein 7)